MGELFCLFPSGYISAILAKFVKIFFLWTFFIICSAFFAKLFLKLRAFGEFFVLRYMDVLCLCLPAIELAINNLQQQHQKTPRNWQRSQQGILQGNILNSLWVAASIKCKGQGQLFSSICLLIQQTQGWNTLQHGVSKHKASAFRFALIFCSP